MRHVSLVQLYEDNREKLLLNWNVAPHVDRRVEIKGSNNYGADLVGHINIIHPERLQVLGLAENEWAMRIGERRFGQMFSDLLGASPPAVIVADGLTPPPAVADICTESGTPLIFSPSRARQLSISCGYISRRAWPIRSVCTVYSWTYWVWASL